jgi:outer membrane protein OmpA-like peptidoglycan-associated protein
VVRYLTEKGIDSRRLRPRGYGETVPVASGHDEVAWSQNRRVQFIILER